MPLDGLFLHHLTKELQKCVGCRADKIHQPNRDELVVLLRSAGFSGKLLITTRSGSARLHITETSPDNPAEPPSFCRLLRKHLSAAKITAIEQVGLDRTVIIRFMSYNEMGDTVYPFLAVELITGRANIILCEESGRIIDALHRSDIERSARLIQPGAKYQLPEAQPKLSPVTADAKAICDAVCDAPIPLSSAILSALEGVSPLVARELAKSVSESDKIANELDENEKSKLSEVISSFKETLESSAAYTVKEQDGTVRDFSYLPISQYGGESEKAESFSLLLDRFYGGKDTAARIRGMAQDILKLLNNLLARTERKLSYRLDDLERSKNREELRIYGELIKANLYLIKGGAEKATVQNYYDENMGYIDIPLDPALSPAANAAKYFKEYKKSYTAEERLTALIEEDKRDIEYIESVLDSLSRAKTAAELSEIRAELSDAGYIHAPLSKKQRVVASKPLEFTSPSGLKILVGKNNRENDLLTLKTAAKTDLWFHTKNIPGSHVILFTDGKAPSNEDLLFAASLAAGHSKAGLSENVPVDFTEVKFVKKPSGAKPGMVIYTTNRTLFVKPLKI